MTLPIRHFGESRIRHDGENFWLSSS